MIHLNNLRSLKKDFKILLFLALSFQKQLRRGYEEATTNIKFYLQKNLCQKQKVVPWFLFCYHQLGHHKFSDHMSKYETSVVLHAPYNLPCLERGSLCQKIVSNDSHSHIIHNHLNYLIYIKKVHVDYGYGTSATH